MGCSDFHQIPLSMDPPQDIGSRLDTGWEKLSRMK
jgi:hypothetical protein